MQNESPTSPDTSTTGEEADGQPAAPPAAGQPRTIVIAGLGLLGGSLAAALKRGNDADIRVYGVARRAESVKHAVSAGLIDAGGTAAEDWIPEADLTVLCVPLQATLDLGRKWAGLFRRDSVVTDIGSVKAPLVSRLRPLLAERGVWFVGSHPMAGSERSGIEYADPVLFSGAAVFVTPHPLDPEHVIDAVESLWRHVGGRTVRIDAELHDQLTARTSHALHLTAGVLVQALLGDDDFSRAAAAGAFRDMTRVAMSPAPMWAEIVRFNQGNVLEALQRIRTQIDRVTRMVEAGEWAAIEAYIEECGRKRREWDQWRTFRNKNE